MTPRKVLYFGFDAAHTSVRRRMRQITEATRLVGLTFRRDRYNSSFTPDWDNIDLGKLRDGHYGERLLVMLGALRTLVRQRARLRDAELVIARNLDLLAIALFGRAIGLYRAPIVYDVFDVRSVLLGTGIKARVMRLLERLLLSRCALLVVSSPGYLDDYFRPILGYHGPALFMENKVDLDILPPDPAVRAAWRAPDRTRAGREDGELVLGWVGALRCARSAEMLRDIARALPWLTVRIAGKPTYCATDRFVAGFADVPNVEYTGEYWFPTGLYDVYRGIDLNWDFDLSKHGVSGRWLLPNRLYEGGYFGVPHLAEAASQTGLYVERLGIGWTRPAEVDAIVAFLREVRDPAVYDPVKQRAVALMDKGFHYRHDITAIFEAVGQR